MKFVAFVLPALMFTSGVVHADPFSNTILETHCQALMDDLKGPSEKLDPICKGISEKEYAEVHAVTTDLLHLSQNYLHGDTENVDTLQVRTDIEMSCLQAIAVTHGAPLNETEPLGKLVSAWVDTERACIADEKCLASRHSSPRFDRETLQSMCDADHAIEDYRQILDEAQKHQLSTSAMQALKTYVLKDEIRKQQKIIDQLTPAYVEVRKHPWTGYQSECKYTP